MKLITQFLNQITITYIINKISPIFIFHCFQILFQIKYHMSLNLKNYSQDQLYQDISYLLSCIRVRQNNFIFLLQHYRDLNPNHTPIILTKQQKKSILAKDTPSIQFLQQQQSHFNNLKYYVKKYRKYFKPNTDKYHANYHHQHQKQYQQQGITIIQMKIYQQLIFKFWYKLRRLIKVSLQRIRLLNVFNQTLSKFYQQILTEINNFMNNNSTNLSQMYKLQALMKKKYMYAIFGNYRYQINKEKEDRYSPMKSGFCIGGSTEFQYQRKNNHINLDQQNVQQQLLMGESKTMYRLKSNKKRKISPVHPPKILKSLNKQQNGLKKKTSEHYNNIYNEQSLSKKKIQRQNKHFLRQVQRLQSRVYDIMEMRIDLNNFCDKKKKRQQNVIGLYDHLFEKNIPNHKIITKYYFNTCNKIIGSQRKKNQLLLSIQNQKKNKQKLNKKHGMQNNSAINNQQMINKSNKKLSEKLILKRKKKHSQDAIEVIKQQSFPQNAVTRIKKLTSRLIKIRPKTAKNNYKYDAAQLIKLTFEETKKRYRKYKKNIVINNLIK